MDYNFRLWAVFIITIASWALAFLAAATLLIIIAVVNLMFVVGIAYLRNFHTKSLPIPKHQNTTNENDRIFISIHIPVYQEPVKMVLKTLKAAKQQHYKDYEILVIYNNTPDPGFWQPIKSFCEKNTDLFKFLNFTEVKDYKAGALNEALPYIDPAGKRSDDSGCRLSITS
ncbi:MAG: glycosyltransferase [Leeuwenhoekiella sp.]